MFAIRQKHDAGKKPFSGLSAMFHRKKTMARRAPHDLSSSAEVLTTSPGSECEQGHTHQVIAVATNKTPSSLATRSPSLVWQDSTNDILRRKGMRLSSYTTASNCNTSDSSLQSDEQIFEFEESKTPQYLSRSCSRASSFSLEADEVKAQGVSAEAPTSESYQESANRMIEAFANALKNNTSSRLANSAVMLPMLNRAEKGRSSVPLLAAADSAPSAIQMHRSTSPPTTTCAFPPEVKTGCAKVVCSTNPRPIHLRSRSHSESEPRKSTIYAEPADAKMSDYRTKALPLLPAWSERDIAGNSRTQTVKVNRKELNKIRSSPYNKRKYARRDSCPSVSVAATTDHEEESSMAAVSSVNHVLGAACVLYWLTDKRRFFHRDCDKLLRRPGAQCLSIEYTIEGFEHEYAGARQVVFKSETFPLGGGTSNPYKSLAYADCQFDVILAKGLTAAIKTSEWAETIAEFKRLLKPGGRLELVVFDQWLNSGPKTAEYSHRFAKGLLGDGYDAELSKSLLPTMAKAGFGAVEVAHLGIPVSWGGPVARVWQKYYEPLRTAREQAYPSVWTAEETPEYRWKMIAEETKVSRSARGVCIISATK